MIGFSLLPQITGDAILAAGIFCLAVLVGREIRVKSPLIDVRTLIKNRLFVTANAIVLISNISNFAVIFLASLYLQEIRNYDARVTGLILLATVIFMVILSPFAGRLSDRTSPALVVGSGIMLSSAGLGIFALTDAGTSLLFIILALSLVGAGIAFCQSPLVRTSVSSVPKDMYGFASGLIETMRLIGMTVSIAITGIVFAVLLGNVHITAPSVPEFLRSFHVSFWIFLGISLIALIITITLPRNAPANS